MLPLLSATVDKLTDIAILMTVGFLACVVSMGIFILISVKTKVIVKNKRRLFSYERLNNRL